MKRFTLEDQKNFSALSGDNNPVHLDEIYARRILWGKIVVHGMHQVIWALNEWVSYSKQAYFELTELKAEFIKALGVGDEAKAVIEDTGKEVTIQVKNDGGSLITEIKLSYTLVASAHNGANLNNNLSEDDVSEYNILNLQQMSETFSLPLCLNKELLQQMYPMAYSRINLDQISLILNTTRCVGNKCPGLNSIYNEVYLKFSNKTLTTPKVEYSIANIHKRLKIVHIKCESDVGSGVIRAFVRPNPTQQASIEGLNQLVKREEFRGQKALVIGGSRGIGESVVKLLALGGADVCFTYFKGKDEACYITESLSLVEKAVRSLQYDALTPSTDAMETITSFEPTHVYYFATPVIFEGENNNFSTKLFTGFSEYYLTGFFKLVEIFSSSEVNFFNPSTVAISEMTDGMWEYSMCKYAGELLGDFIKKYRQNLNVFSPRLPRVMTDQTASLLPVNAPRTEGIVLPLLRQFHKNEY